MSQSRLIAYSMLFATSIIWGVAAPVLKFTLDSFPPLIFLLYRFFLTTLFLLPILVLFGKQQFSFNRREMGMIILASLLGSTVNLGLLFWGFNLTSSISGSVLSATSPIFVVLAGAFFLKEQITKSERIGLLLAFLGTLVITLSPTAFDHQSGNLLGNLLILVANFAWVGFVIISKIELQHKTSPLFLTTTSFLVGFVSFLPLTLIKFGSLNQITSFIAAQPFSAHLGVWYIALLSGALAYWLYQEGQRRIEASEATIFSYLSPIFAVPLSIFWLGETITIPFIAGAIIIVGGVAIAEYKKRRKPLTSLD